MYTDVDVVAERPYAEDLLTALRNGRSRPQTTHYALFSSVFQDIVQEALSPEGSLAKGGRLPDGTVTRLTDALLGRLR